MIKKGAALLMALALCLTLLPASTLAAEAQGAGRSGADGPDAGKRRTDAGTRPEWYGRGR